MSAHPARPPNAYLPLSRYHGHLLRCNLTDKAAATSEEPPVPASEGSRHQRITGNDVPDDIWRLIASHIAQSTKANYLLPLISVNRTFFDFILDLKYREVGWMRIDEDFVKTLKRLQYPIISRRVRQLYVRSGLIKFLFTPHPLFKRLVSHSGVITTIKTYFAIPISTFSRGRAEEIPTSAVSKMGLSQEQVLGLFVTAVKGMTGVIQFHLEMRDQPVNKEATIFLILTRTAFSLSLRRLVLRAQISEFKDILPMGSFDCLDELDFYFDYSPTRNFSGEIEASKKENPDAKDLMDIVLPFIASRRTVLRSLGITSFSSVDLSDFFDGLPAMPALRRLRLHIGLSKANLSEPSSLIRVLETHSRSLLHVDIKLNTVRSKHDWTEVQDLLCLSPQCLAGLESLEMPCVSLTKALPVLRRSCETLTKLRLVGHYLSTEEVTQVVSPFRFYPLEHLHLEVRRVDFLLLHLLASGLPNLRSLILAFEENINSGQLMPSDLSPAVRATFSDWKLREIDLRQDSHNRAAQQYLSVAFCDEHRAMRLISAQVPSIRSWQGLPKAWMWG